jgi:cell division protein FtsB
MKKAVSWGLIILGVLLIINISKSILDLRGRTNIVKDVQKEYEQVQGEYNQIQKEYEKVQSPEFIEQEARNKLNMTRPNEIMVVPPEPTTVPSPTPTPQLSLFEKMREKIGW